MYEAIILVIGAVFVATHFSFNDASNTLRKILGFSIGVITLHVFLECWVGTSKAFSISSCILFVPYIFNELRYKKNV